MPMPDPSWKLISILHAKHGLDHEAFDAYWRADHASLIQGQSDFWRYVRRYVQKRLVPGIPSPIDSPDQASGVSELWFDSVEDIERAFATPGFRDVIEPDLANFIDLDASGSMVAEFVPIDPRPGARVTLFAAAYRAEGLTRAEALEYWRVQHPPLVESVANYQRHIRSYVQNHPHEYGGSTIGKQLDFDLAPEMGFDSAEDMTRAYLEPDYLSTIRADELVFANVKGGIALVTHENVLYEQAAER
jgi:uncharacterized protein (TIGR02118 family)